MVGRISTYYPKLAILRDVTVILPFAVYILHAQLFREWIIDDAGISFVYARNFVGGHGLVSQPGIEPVEGFSNFSWVLLLALPFFAKLFHPIITPKLMSGVLVFLSFITLYRTFTFISPRASKTITIIVLSLLAANTSFVVWTTSGLENPLYVLLLSLFFYVIVRISKDEYHDYRLTGGILAILATLIAITRPDGLSYFFVFPIYLILSQVYWPDASKKSVISQMLHYLLGFMLVFGTFLIFRFWYFGDVVPNTYYAKGGPPTIWELLPKAYTLLSSVAEHFEILILVWLVVATIYLIGSKNLRRPHLLLLLLLACSVSVYILLPEDWMGEFRFATPFFIFFYAYIIIIGEVMLNVFILKKRSKVLIPFFLIVIFVVASIFSFAKRSYKFASNPTVPFSSVANRYGYRFNEYVARLDVRDGSVLLPDLGGTLYYSNLRVYDLVGLTDKTIARTRGNDQEAFYNYIFETLKPTFIHTHGNWAYTAAFDKDDRFRRDYLPINENPDSWIQDEFGLTIYSGDYVRKDLGQYKLEVLFELNNDPS
jgi:hypothetical protein